MKTNEEITKVFIDIFEPEEGWDESNYIRLGNMCSNVLIELTKRLKGLAEPPITEALTDEQIMTVEDEIEEARRRC